METEKNANNPTEHSNLIRKFDTGATRDSDEGKFDYEGFLSPVVIEAFGAYMHKHRKQADGSLRASDNWQKGIPRDQYIKSLLRHVHQLWKLHRNYRPVKDEKGNVVSFEDACCAILFNVQGYLHEYLRKEVAVGSTVRVLDASIGALGAIGMVGVVASPESEITNGFQDGIKISVGDETWGLGAGGKVEAI